ncbi:MAG: hypothetical protein QNJ77_02065 [Acidimicrobiia bacterium]|nr:hypothetical protein [Acidimicrobiia bacterium]
MEYRHTQYGYTWFFAVIWMVLMSVIIVMLGDIDDTETVVILAITGAFLLFIGAITLWFSRLTATVGIERVAVFFGAGWPRRRIEVHNILAIRQVRNKWYYGWGIRKIPGGWMYNVWGLDAVELELADGKKFRIGTDEPGDLLAALTASTALRPG